MPSSSIPSLLFSLLLKFSVVFSASFTITNNCAYTVWPGVLASAGSSSIATTGFALAPAESRTLDAPVPWSGRFWARTLCSADSASGRFYCATADCGSSSVECAGRGAAPPATLAEFTLGGATDFFDVSLVDGYNVPVLVVPQGGGGASCAATGCLADLNGLCPAELRVAAPDGETAACRSACEAFGAARYCCSGEFATPDTCPPTEFSQFFKNACPRAYSYAYDDATSTFTCPTASTAGYTINFCPGTTSHTHTQTHLPAHQIQIPLITPSLLGCSLKSMRGGYGGELPLINDTMPLLLDSATSRAAGRTPPASVLRVLGVATAVALLLGVSN